MKKILLAATALVSLTGVAMADSTDVIVGAAASKASPLSSAEMSAVTGSYAYVTQSNSTTQSNSADYGYYVQQSNVNQTNQQAIAADDSYVSALQAASNYARVWQRQ